MRTLPLCFIYRNVVGLTHKTNLHGREGVSISVPHDLTRSANVMVASRLPPDHGQRRLHGADVPVDCVGVTLGVDGETVMVSCYERSLVRLCWCHTWCRWKVKFALLIFRWEDGKTMIMSNSVVEET